MWSPRVEQVLWKALGGVDLGWKGMIEMMDFLVQRPSSKVFKMRNISSNPVNPENKMKYCKNKI